jgi:hypothetical protein
VIKSIFRSHKTFLSSFSSVFSLGILGLSQLASAVPAEVFMNQPVQEYDGNPKFPNFSTDPPAGIVINGFEEKTGFLAKKYGYGYGGYGQYGKGYGYGSYGAYGSDDDDA